jgi:hypothetical protein
MDFEQCSTWNILELAAGPPRLGKLKFQDRRLQNVPRGTFSVLIVTAISTGRTNQATAIDIGCGGMFHVEHSRFSTRVPQTRALLDGYGGP